jgi:hypothetical protein
MALEWLQIYLTPIARENGMGHLMDWGWQQVLLMVGGFDVDWGSEIKFVNAYVNIREGDMGGDGPGWWGVQGQGDLSHESITEYHLSFWAKGQAYSLLIWECPPPTFLQKGHPA